MDEDLKWNVGHAGFLLSLAPWITAIVLTILQPGWRSLLSALGGLIILGTPPIALILSVVGIVRSKAGDRTRKFAIAGAAISGVLILLLLLSL